MTIWHIAGRIGRQERARRIANAQLRDNRQR